MRCEKSGSDRRFGKARLQPRDIQEASSPKYFPPIPYRVVMYQPVLNLLTYLLHLDYSITITIHSSLWLLNLLWAVSSGQFLTATLHHLDEGHNCSLSTTCSLNKNFIHTSSSCICGTRNEPSSAAAVCTSQQFTWRPISSALQCTLYLDTLHLPSQ